MYLQSLKDYDNLVNDFKDSYKGWYNRNQSKELDITNKELIMYFSLEKGFNVDMMPLTFQKLVKGSNVYIDQNIKGEILNWFSDEILKYILNGTDKSYDEWHSMLGNAFVVKVNNELFKDKYYPMQYGKAQKLINMTMKYLSTCDNADKYEERFKDCHMALDSKILDWYYNEVRPDIKKSYRKSWSSLDEISYFEIQNDIREYCKTHNYIPFVQEWPIWAEYMKK